MREALINIHVLSVGKPRFHHPVCSYGLACMPIVPSHSPSTCKTDHKLHQKSRITLSNGHRTLQIMMPCRYTLLNLSSMLLEPLVHATYIMPVICKYVYTLNYTMLYCFAINTKKLFCVTRTTWSLMNRRQYRYLPHWVLHPLLIVSCL
jgi:hypothetical protein